VQPFRFAQYSKPLALSAVALAATAALEGQARAQAAPTSAAEASAPGGTQTVEVTGFRTQNTRSIATKEASPVTIESVASDQIGQLPDFNVGDALKRVTGVNTLEYQGEPRYVVVRGLNANYNTTLIDGFAIATADIGSRQVLMEVLPSNFVYRIDVTKTFLPENDGGSIGGTTDLVTASGFTHPDGKIVLSAKAGENLMDKRHGGATPIGEASAKWGRRFGPGDQFAFLGSASYWTRHIHVPQVEAGGSPNWYNADGTPNSAPYGGDGLAVPAERRWYNYDNQRERFGVTARLDWQPEGSLKGHVASYYFKQHEASDRYSENAQLQSSTRVSGQTPTTGTLSNVLQYMELGRLRWSRALYGVNGELDADLAPEWSLALRGSVSRSTVQNPQTWDKFQQAGLAFGYSYAPGMLPTFTASDPSVADDPTRYANAYHRQERTGYAERVRDVQLDLRHNADEDSSGLGLVTGARFVTTRMDTDFLRRSWNSMAYTFADVADGSTCGLQCNTPFPTIDAALADRLWTANSGSVTPVDDTAAQNGGTYGVHEDVSAVYAQSQWRGERLFVAGGLRFEHTSFGSDGLRQTSGTWGPVSASGRYGDLLPSLAGSWATGAHGKLRFGASRTIGRPRPDQLTVGGGVLSTTSSPATLSSGNPDLKPRRSDNLDLGHDWVLDGGRSMFSMALFHKSIRDEIFRFGELETIGGQQVLVTQPRNADGLVRVTGVEVGVIKELGGLEPWLNGFTASFNATALDVHYPVTLGDRTVKTLNILPEQPRYQWNAALTYEARGLHAELAWNHTGALWDDRFPNYTSQAQFYRNRFQQATDKFDLKLAYDLSRSVSMTLDVLNLTGQGFQYDFGRSQEYVQSAWKVAPSVMAGLNLTL
jgi:TonB-dependent receptor